MKTYLVDYVLVVPDEVLEGDDGLPGVPLSVQAAAGGFVLLVEADGQRVPATNVCEEPNVNPEAVL